MSAKENIPQNTFQEEKTGSPAEELFTASFVPEKKAEMPVSPAGSTALQTEKKRFVPPVLEEKKRPQFDRANESVKEPAQENLSEIKNLFQQKILEAQKIQAENQDRTFNPPAQKKIVPPAGKIVPVDAVNIIHAPLDDFASDDYADYPDEEERLATAGSVDTSFAPHLFDENVIPEEEREALDWQAFLGYCEEHDFPLDSITRLQGAKGFLAKENCYIKIANYQAETFNKAKKQLENLLCTFLGRTVKIQVTIVAYELVSDEKLREKASNNSQIQMLMKEFGAEIYRCYDIKHDRKN